MIESLSKNLKSCRRCNLYKTRHQIVIGRGNPKAKILLIGEAPGNSEDLIGEPFVGMSGRLLDDLIIDAGISLNDCFITNCVLCHPTNTLGGENRAPKREEILLCAENLSKIFDSISFFYVILIGEFARKYYLKRFPNAVCIYHPAYILRTGGKKSQYYLKTKNQLIDLRECMENDFKKSGKSIRSENTDRL